jgi:hypothetical protein
MLRSVVELSYNASTLMTKVIACYSYCSGLLEVVIAYYSYRSSLKGSVVAPYSYRFKVTTALSLLIALLLTGFTLIYTPGFLPLVYESDWAAAIHACERGI